MAEEQCSIIHVEDSDDDSQLLSIHLKRANISVRFIRLRDGEEAINYLLKNPETRKTASKHSLVVLDLGLPKFSGFEVLEELKKQEDLSHRVIVFSGSSSPDDRKKCISLGANDYFVKPFQLVDYEAFIKGPLATHLSEVCPHITH